MNYKLLTLALLFADPIKADTSSLVETATLQAIIGEV